MTIVKKEENNVGSFTNVKQDSYEKSIVYFKFKE